MDALIQSDILFPYDRSSLNDISMKGREKLSRIGRKLKAFLEDQRSKTSIDPFAVVLEGYTDTFGSDEYNQKLSFDRAQSVISLWERNGFSPNQFDIAPVGFGRLSSKLKVHRGNKTGQAPNRRIEIRLVPKFETLIGSLKVNR